MRLKDLAFFHQIVSLNNSLYTGETYSRKYRTCSALALLNLTKKVKSGIHALTYGMYKYANNSLNKAGICHGLKSVCVSRLVFPVFSSSFPVCVFLSPVNSLSR